MTVTWIPQARGWDGPNDEWLPSDDAFTNFLDSFTPSDAEKLKRESRMVAEQPRVATTTVAHLVVEAIETPSVRTAKALKSLSNRELVDALTIAKSRQERQTRRRVTDAVLARPGKTVTW